MVEVEISGIGILRNPVKDEVAASADAPPERRCQHKRTRRSIMNMPKHLLPTTVVGSYPQPEWLVDRATPSKSVPRTRMHAMWRLPEVHLEEAQDDATIVAIRDMERAGIDIVTDGEIRRESYSNRFATALEGIDIDNPAIIVSRSGHETPVPRVVGLVRRTQPVELRDMEFLRRNTDRAAKITLPGPFTMSQQARNEFYKDEEELAMAFAEAVNAEVLDLQKAGADVIQLDEPWVRNNPDFGKTLCGQGDQPRAARHRGADRGASVLRLRRRGAGFDQAGRLFVPGRTGGCNKADQISIEAWRSRNSIPACCGTSRRRRSCWACSISATPRSKRPKSSPTASGTASIRDGRAAHSRARLRHEVHAAPDRLRQAEGDVRRRRDRAQGDQLSSCCVVPAKAETHEPLPFVRERPQIPTSS